MAETKIANTIEVPEGKGKVFQSNGKAIAIFQLGGEFFAIDNACVHRGGPLGQGMLDGNIVTCPLHGWEYDVTTGECSNGGKVNSYKVEIKNDEIYVDI